MLGFGASTRNGGIVHPGYKWPGADQALWRGDWPRALPRHARCVRARQAAHRERGDRLRVARVRLLDLAYGPSHVGDLVESGRALTDIGVEATFVKAASARRSAADAYHGGLAVSLAGLLHQASTSPGSPTRPRALGRTFTRRPGATIRRQADGRIVVETDRGAIIAKDVVAATNGYTDGFAPALRRRIIPIGSTSSRPSRCPRTSPRSSRRRAGRSSTRRTSSTTGTCRPTAAWCSVAGPASCQPRSTGLRASSTRGCSRCTRSWRATVSSTPGRQRRVHVRSHAARRTHGRRHLRDGLLRDGRRPHDLAGNGGGWLAVGRCGARAVAPAVPVGAGSRGPAMVPAVRR